MYYLLILFFDLIKTGNIYILNLGQWIFVDSFLVNWEFCFDSLTSIMLIVVTFISSLVHLYSSEYMEFDPHLPRFMSYLSFFTFCMLILVTANNLLQMFVGWEGVGVSSYLLINFYIDDLTYASLMNYKEGLRSGGSIVAFSFLIAASALILIAMIDAPYQLFEHNKKTENDQTRSQRRNERYRWSTRGKTAYQGKTT